jgi:hypothetical protein
MIDWHAELISITSRIAEIEEKISLRSQKVHQLSEGNGRAAAVSILTLLQERLKNAETHKRVIESRSSKESIRGEAVGLSECARENIKTRSTETTVNTAGLASKQVHIHNITIQVK